MTMLEPMTAAVRAPLHRRARVPADNRQRAFRRGRGGGAGAISVASGLRFYLLLLRVSMTRLNDPPTPSWVERLAVVTFLTVVGFLTVLGLIIAIALREL